MWVFMYTVLCKNLEYNLTEYKVYYNIPQSEIWQIWNYLSSYWQYFDECIDVYAPCNPCNVCLRPAGGPLFLYRSIVEACRVSAATFHLRHLLALVWNTWNRTNNRIDCFVSGETWNRTNPCSDTRAKAEDLGEGAKLRTIFSGGGQVGFSALRVWEYSWRDYPNQHASSMSPHHRAPRGLCVFVWMSVCTRVFVCIQ